MRGRGARPPVNTLGGSSAAAQAAVGVEVTRPDVVMLAGATVFRKRGARPSAVAPRDVPAAAQTIGKRGQIDDLRNNLGRGAMFRDGARPSGWIGAWR